MILQQFPDLQWLKQQIKQRFANRRGPGNLPLETDGFPSVIIHTKTKQAYRPDVTGPISLFINIKGTSTCVVDGRRMLVTEDTYCISNRLQEYTLEIDADDPVETFNIHIGEHFSEKALQGLMYSSARLLDNADALAVPPIDLYNKLYPKSGHFKILINKLKQLEHADGFNKMLFEETLLQVMAHLLKQHTQVMASIECMPAVKAAVRAELYKRVSVASDFIHAYYLANIQLDEIAAAACLSKFHFLRLFKSVYNVSPYQYIQALRLEKAHNYLAGSQVPINEIAELLGYENSNSFSRIFHQRTGVYPSQYRAAIN